MIPRGTAVLFAALVSAAAVPTLLAPAASPRQVVPPGAGGSSTRADFLRAESCTRIFDPKLDGGRAAISYVLDPASAPYHVTVSAISVATGKKVATIFKGFESGSADPKRVHWNGRDRNGDFVDPGAYTIRSEARDGRGQLRSIEQAVDVIRAGIRILTFESSAASGVNEWQTVYFMKAGRYAFYATPATGEYLSRAETGEISDLDLDDGSPRPVPPVHTLTDEPLLEPSSTGSGYIYENDWHNYPVCYLAGATPQVTVKFGFGCTLEDGTNGSCNLPVAGFDVRVVAHDESGEWSAAKHAVAPGGTATLTGPALPAEATRVERTIVWSFEYRETGGTKWQRIPGRIETPHRIYTILHEPQWATGAKGTQYSGPWVEVLEYFHTFAAALGVTADTDERVVEALVKGFFGQNGSLTTAIEDVHYDCPSEGGDGGATHYHDWGSWTMDLSRLLNAHANGEFVNCSDCASGTSVMLSMLGIDDYEMMRLGTMNLRAIWGIGTDDYTLNLWGGGSHGFSYHHIITRDGGTTISDGTMWVDEDGNADKLPGTPGFNHDRDWNNYESLAASNNVTWSLDPLPKLR